MNEEMNGAMETMETVAEAAEEVVEKIPEPEIIWRAPETVTPPPAPVAETGSNFWEMAGYIGVFTLVGIGAYHGFKFIQKKWKAHKEQKKRYTEVPPNTDGDDKAETVQFREVPKEGENKEESESKKDEE